MVKFSLVDKLRVQTLRSRDTERRPSGRLTLGRTGCSCCLDYLMIVVNSCMTISFFSSMVHWLTPQIRRRTGRSAIVMNLSTRTNDRRTHQISIHWIICIWGVMLDKYDKHSPKPKTTAELKIVLQQIWDSSACHKSS